MSIRYFTFYDVVKGEECTIPALRLRKARRMAANFFGCCLNQLSFLGSMDQKGQLSSKHRRHLEITRERREERRMLIGAINLAIFAEEKRLEREKRKEELFYETGGRY